MTTGTLMTAADAARVLGITPDGIRKLNNRGLLPCTRTVSGVRLFDQDVVAALKERRDRRPTPWSRYASEAAS